MIWIHLPLPSSARKPGGDCRGRGIVERRQGCFLSSSHFPPPGLGREPLKFWNLGCRVNLEPDCFPVPNSQTDMMCRAEQPPLSAAQGSKSRTLTTFRRSWNVVKPQVPMPATTGVISFPWKFPWYLLFICKLFGWGFVTLDKKIYILVNFCSVISHQGAEKREQTCPWNCLKRKKKTQTS